jgi:hypothetical protein
MDTPLDRSEILLLRRPQADEAVAKRWIRNRERSDDDRNGSVLFARMTAAEVAGILTWAALGNVT